MCKNCVKCHFLYYFLYILTLKIGKTCAILNSHKGCVIRRVPNSAKFLYKNASGAVVSTFYDNSTFL